MVNGIRLRQGDITAARVDALANTATERLPGGGGVEAFEQARAARRGG